MSNFTPRANLRLPGGGSTGTILPDEQVDIDVLNDNFRKIDALLGARNIPSTSSYSGSMDGDLVYARDTKLLSVYDANSAGLVSPRVAGGTRFKGTQAQMAAFTGAENGDSFFSTTNNSEYVRSSGAWLGVATVARLQSAALASATWTILNNPATWIIDAKMIESGEWNNGIVIPTDGVYLISGSLLVAANIPVIYGAKLNNTAASIAGVVVAGQSTGFSNNTLVTFAREMRLAAGDVLTPAVFTSGSAGPYGITPSGTGFSVTRV